MCSNGLLPQYTKENHDKILGIQKSIVLFFPLKWLGFNNPPPQPPIVWHLN
jgi:hypothetical protein